MRSLLCVWVSVLVCLAGCAPKTAAVVPGAPRHPDFVFPLMPAGVTAAQMQRMERGWQYLQLDDHGSAEREFAAALKQQPSFYPAEAALAYLTLARGDEKDAVEGFDRVLEVDAAYVPALVGRGQALLELDRIGDALASFEAALVKDPSMIGLRSRVEVLRVRAMQETLARAKTAAEARRWEEAKAAYQQAIAASPESAFLYRELGLVEQQAGQPAEALEHFRRAVQLDAADAKSLSSIGGLLDRQGDVMGALAAYERARAIDPAEVPESVVARLREAVRLAKLPAEYRAIPEEPTVTRAQVASLIGVRLEPLIARMKPQQVIITDIRNHWAQQWIMPVVRAGIMDTLPNYEFEPARRVRRGEFAATVSRLLTLIGALKPQLEKRWQAAAQANQGKIADVPPGHLSYQAVSHAVSSGVMTLSGGNFDLLRPVSGAEALDVIGRLEAMAR